MTQTFIVTIESEGTITAREVEEALIFNTGACALDFIHDDIILVKARKTKTTKEK